MTASKPRTIRLLILLTLFVSPVSADEFSERAQSIVKTTGVQGGLILHLGTGNGRQSAALRVNNRYQVHGLDRDSARLKAARDFIKSTGQYGDVAVDLLTGNSLPYIENLFNLVVVDDAMGIPADEIMRVLAPNGVVWQKIDGKWTARKKPRPDNIDEWTHYLHDASGNAVAHDEVAGPPRHMQWVGSPRWSRHHDRMASMSALVSTGGRLIYIMDEGSRISIQLPARWKVIARDAFNGTILWKRDIESWQSHLWPLKSGPTQLARRLVGQSEQVFVTLGLEAPVTLLNAATGETIRTYENTKSTEELVVVDDTLIALVHDGRHPLADYAPLHNTGDQARVGREFSWNEKVRRVVGVDIESGKELWSHSSVVSPLTLTANEGNVVFHDGKKVVCLDRVTGKEKWSAEPAERRSKIPFNFGPKLVLYEDLVIFAGGDRLQHTYDINSGKELWKSDHARGGYQSPEDLLIAGGLIWSAPTTATRDTGAFTGRDPRTGQVKKTFAPNVETYWFHHRCYIAKATDRFLMPSRTGIEFVDHQKENWDINHWVRGGCLYGVMPCNGLVYAPPHNCACYPEAKLYGLNALAPASSGRALPKVIPEAGRLQKGPAYDRAVSSANNAFDWPTYRHDPGRSGRASTVVPANVKKTWDIKAGRRLTSLVAANNRVFVADIDAHTVHAIDATSGKTDWSFTAGGRVDSPPALKDGLAVFGAADGYVYCVAANTGELVWRYRAAPLDRRMTAFEQLESVWPVHGNVLIQNDQVYAVAGRSNFLDDGLRLVRLELNTGRKISETVIDEIDPETGTNMQDKLQVLQMGVGLPDILSSNGDNIFMRSQKFSPDGVRMGTGPNSGDFAGQAAEQGGSDAHMFAPMGFLDDTWFHRSYWVFGRSFAGGHAGYYQAGRFAPSGRILVHDNEHVYGFGRKPEYLKWTTTIEHQLFKAPREAPVVPETARQRRRGKSGTSISVVSKRLNPTKTALAVSAWARPLKPNGVVVSHGGPSVGYALTVAKGRPQFFVRSNKNNVVSIRSKVSVANRWAHLTGVLTAEGEMKLFVDGKLAAFGKAKGLIEQLPAQNFEVGIDTGGSVGSYKQDYPFTGEIDDVQVFHGNVSDEDVGAMASGGQPRSATCMLNMNFEQRDANDSSGRKNHGQLNGAVAVKGRNGTAMRFQTGNGAKSNSFMKYDWTKDMPLLARSMLIAPRNGEGQDKLIFVLGPPDIINEEETFKKLTERDPGVQKILADQDAALLGRDGGILRVVSAQDGTTVNELKVDFLPVWDSLIAANGRLFVSTTDGRVVCLSDK